MEEMKFNAFMDGGISKSTDTDTGSSTYTIKGMASTGRLDLGNDIIDPKGIDISYFVEHGYINDNHDGDKIIGYPTNNCKVIDEGLYVEGKLFKDNPNVKKYIELADNLEKAGSQRKVGLSIEGAVKSRNINDNRVIESVIITGLAVTMAPCNTDATIDEIVKSFVTGYGTTPETQQDAGALRREQISSSITNLTYSTSLQNPKDLDKLWKDVVNYMSKNNKLGYEESIVTLQLAKGLSRKDAEKAVLDIRRNELDSEGEK